MVAVGEGLLGCYDDRFSGVNSHRVDVLHRADDDRVISGVAHHFVLVFLPAEDAHFNQNLADSRMQNPLTRNLHQLPHVMRRASAQTPQSVGRTDEQREASERLGCCDYSLDRIAGQRLADRKVNLFADLLEEVAVFCLVDRYEIAANELDSQFIEGAVMGQC